jgi:hypothetical protein
VQLLNAETVFFGPELHIPVPTVTEVYGAIRRMKNIRAPGEDIITAELIKEGRRCLWKNIYQLIVSVWEKEVMSEEWQTATICPILKKGNKSECKNYRGISLLNVAYKTLLKYWHSISRYILKRFLVSIKVELGKVTELLIIFTIWQILEKSYEYNISLHHLYIDFRYA